LKEDVQLFLFPNFITMKKNRSLSLVACTLLLLGSCSKKESEQTQPEAAANSSVSVPATQVNDLIRKVVRYNSSGGIEDSILFKYDSQNRITKIEYGTFTNGGYKNKTDFAYISSATGSNIILEKDSTLAATGKYYLNSSATFYVNSDYNKASSVAIQSPVSYGVAYDSFGFVKSVRQSGQKQTDSYLHVTFQSQNNNLTESVTDSDLMGNDRTNYEYFQEPYLHNLYFNAYEGGMRLFWNYQLTDVFSLRHSFLGKRNANLVKKQTTNLGLSNSTEISYQYEFNSLGLVSKIKTASVSANGATTPMKTKYEIFYY
jgi:hypothetical protein